MVQVDYWGNETLIDRGVRAEFTTFAVCGACNTGWMHDLEQRVAPFMKQMILGNLTWLTAERRMLIAQWLLKTAMVEDSRLETKKPFFARSERAQFHRGLTGSLEYPFPNWLNVWIAACLPMVGLYSVPLPGHSETTNGNQRARVRWYTFTFAAGHLVLQFLAATLPFEEGGLGTFGRAGDQRFAGVARRIYPSGPSLVVPSWPELRNVLRNPDVSLDDFSKRWAMPLD